jgi:hypothetical protein
MYEILFWNFAQAGLVIVFEDLGIEISCSITHLKNEGRRYRVPSFYSSHGSFLHEPSAMVRFFTNHHRILPKTIPPLL